MIIAKRERYIEWGDCDPARIVFNPRYFEWFDACTAGVFAHVGLKKPDLTKRFGFVGWPLVESRAKFLKPSKFGDTVIIETSVTEFRKSSFDIRHQLFNQGVLGVEAFETRVWVGQHPDDPNGIKSQPIPQEVIDCFKD
jgi:4-hydroxybenzoyl-CoA thioesterase